MDNTIQTISDYIHANPQREVMVSHGDGKYTFHNVGFWQILKFYLKTQLKKLNFKSAKDTPKRLMEIIMGQYNIRPNQEIQGGIDPNTPPPPGKVIGWTPERGYYYQNLAGSTTHNQPYKKDQAVNKQRRKKWETYHDNKEQN